MIARTFTEGMEAYLSGPPSQCVTDQALAGYRVVAELRRPVSVPGWVRPAVCKALEALDEQDQRTEFDFSIYTIDDVQSSMADEPGYAETRQFPR